MCGALYVPEQPGAPVYISSLFVLSQSIGVLDLRTMARLSSSFIGVLFGALVAVPAFASPRARALNPAFGQPGSKICLSWSEGNDPSLADLKTPHVIGYVTVSMLYVMRVHTAHLRLYKSV